MIGLISYALIGYSLTITGPGMTAHGVIDSSQYQNMKYKIGHKSVINPWSLGLVYKSDYFQGGAVYLKDCFGHNAGAVIAGPKFDFFNHFSLGAVGGLYVRESMVSDGIPLVKRMGGAELIPMTGATFAVSVPVTKRISIETNVIANWYINYGTLGVKIDLP